MSAAGMSGNLFNLSSDTDRPICTITFVKKLIFLCVCVWVVLLPTEPQMAALYLKLTSALQTQMCVNVWCQVFCACERRMACRISVDVCRMSRHIVSRSLLFFLPSPCHWQSELPLSPLCAYNTTCVCATVLGRWPVGQQQRCCLRGQ